MLPLWRLICAEDIVRWGERPTTKLFPWTERAYPNQASMRRRSIIKITYPVDKIRKSFQSMARNILADQKHNWFSVFESLGNRQMVVPNRPKGWTSCPKVCQSSTELVCAKKTCIYIFGQTVRNPDHLVPAKKRIEGVHQSRFTLDTICSIAFSFESRAVFFWSFVIDPLEGCPCASANGLVQ